MKIKYLFLLIIVFTLFSCQQNKTTEIVVSSVNIDNLCNEVLKKQNHISLIKYNVRRIDTLDIDNVSDNRGTATLQRNGNDSIFGFSFYGKRNDVDRENFYVENRHFQVFNEDRTYRIETNYGRHTLGSPGGQMIVVDLLNLDFYTGEISVANCDNGNFILTKNRFASDSSLNRRQLYIDKNSLMPYKIHSCRVSGRLGLKQTTTYYISEIEINEQVSNNELSNMEFLSEYTQKQIVIDKSADSLLHKKVPSTVLFTFDGDSLKLDNIKSKVVLLDFWELWCGPCRKALPKVEELSNKFDPNDLIIIGIVSENIEKAKNLISTESITFLQAEGNQELKSKFMVNSVPRYVLIDQNRVIRKLYYGYSDNIEADIKGIL